MQRARAGGRGHQRSCVALKVPPPPPPSPGGGTIVLSLPSVDVPREDVLLHVPSPSVEGGSRECLQPRRRHRKDFLLQPLAPGKVPRAPGPPQLLLLLDQGDLGGGSSRIRQQFLPGAASQNPSQHWSCRQSSPRALNTSRGKGAALPAPKLPKAPRVWRGCPVPGGGLGSFVP